MSFIAEQAGGKVSEATKEYTYIHEYDRSILDIADHHSQMGQMQLQLRL